MRKLLFLFILFFTGKLFVAGNDSNNVFQDIQKSKNSVSTINALDTVVFDMSQAQYISNTVRFPVYILSDDSVYALDFAFKYDQSHLHYDTTFDLTNYMQAFSYYNPVDSTVRFTSSSISQVYTNDTVLADIEFTVLSGALNVTDIFSITVQLNGDPCSYKIIPPLNPYVHELNAEKSVFVYPNPVKNKLHVFSNEKAVVSVFDFKGSEVLSNVQMKSGENEIDVKNLLSGIYLIQINSEKGLIIKRIIIN